MKMVRPGIAIGIVAVRAKAVILDQVEDRDAAFLLDIGVAPQDGPFVERDLLDTMVGHGSALIPIERLYPQWQRRWAKRRRTHGHRDSLPDDDRTSDAAPERGSRSRVARRDDDRQSNRRRHRQAYPRSFLRAAPRANLRRDQELARA